MLRKISKEKLSLVETEMLEGLVRVITNEIIKGVFTNE